MPVSFLTEEQRQRYGRFCGEPTQEQLSRYFFLDDRDRTIVNSHRGDHSRLGFAIQLCTARFLGTFLEDLSDVPQGVIHCIARQLRVEQLSCFVYYGQGETRWDHAAEIRRRHCGFKDFADAALQFRLNRWLYALCWTGTDRTRRPSRWANWVAKPRLLSERPSNNPLSRHACESLVLQCQCGATSVKRALTRWPSLGVGVTIALFWAKTFVSVSTEWRARQNDAKRGKRDGAKTDQREARCAALAPEQQAEYRQMVRK